MATWGGLGWVWGHCIPCKYLGWILERTRKEVRQIWQSAWHFRKKSLTFLIINVFYMFDSVYSLPHFAVHYSSYPTSVMPRLLAHPSSTLTDLRSYSSLPPPPHSYLWQIGVKWDRDPPPPHAISPTVEWDMSLTLHKTLMFYVPLLLQLVLFSVNVVLFFRKKVTECALTNKHFWKK